MSSIALIVTAAIALGNSTFHVLDKDIKSPIAKAMSGEYVVAQQYDGNDPHGADPHGADPHGETHDYDLPANADSYKATATTDVYGGAAGNNSQQPYNGSN